MSYEMGGQQTAYPYPPPGATTVTVAPKRSRFSKWWPISFFIAAVIFFIIGGALIGSWAGSAATDCYDNYYSGSSYRGSSSSCSTAADGQFWGGVVCIGLGSLCKLVFWILLIVWCVKRSSTHTVTTAYAYQPVNYSAAPPPAAGPAVPPPLYQNAPQNQSQPYNAQPYQGSPSPAPYSKEGHGAAPTAH
ncbi:hypothetical protein N658DRAFT_519533 [Parathielavia hyrcaniae]|uniref:Uncharacterized protein n=1 Tax=Parathielavia hyrcaniae TaxID=113614 RepID=A0AAN6PUE2_9PEZI|nr:hypothetical protein N658DRAFT_519533 [Parathielavia hyrcaniae]